jgi:hypothetical protein
MSTADADSILFPVVPLRDYTLKPGAVVPLFVGRPASIAAIRVAMTGSKQLFAVTQRNADLNTPALHDLHAVGTVAEVQVLTLLPDGTLKIQLTGLRLGRLTELVEGSGYLSGTVEFVPNAEDGAMGLRPPTVLDREAPDEIIETIPLEGFDPLGDPELRRERSGNLWLVFNFMPPSWVPQAEYKGFGRCANFGKELQDAIGSPVLWDDREFFLIEQPGADCIDRIRRFLSEFKVKNAPSA